MTAIDLTSIQKESALIGSLLNADAYPHPVSKLEFLETHISWVILTGPFAYKIKKPVALAFLDFSTIESRLYYCNEELRLNRRWAPDLYLDVVPICGSYEHPSIGGDGEVIEYALKMVQFPQEARLDAQLDAGLLGSSDMDELAEMIAEQHGVGKPRKHQGSEEALRYVRQPMLDNFQHLASHCDRRDLGRLEAWTEASLRDLRSFLVQRQETGLIRECHGDLHLRNLVRLPSGIVAFDCVEFSSDLRNIDVISDVAFLAMDLVARERQDLAYLFVNRYLECTGDYAGMAVFGLYYVYHCLIRAKVAAIRSLEQAKAADKRRDRGEIAHYCTVALDWIEDRRPYLIAMHGYSGSGKTWLSQRVMSRLPAIRVRSDIERKRMHGLGETESSESAVGRGMYNERSRSDVYEKLCATAQGLLRSSHNVILDASFLKRENRQQASKMARRLGAKFVLIDVRTDKEELIRRLRLRQDSTENVSEANIDVLQYQFGQADPLTKEELATVVTVAADSTCDPDVLIERIRKDVEP